MSILPDKAQKKQRFSTLLFNFLYQTKQTTKSGADNFSF